MARKSMYSLMNERINARNCYVGKMQAFYKALFFSDCETVVGANPVDNGSLDYPLTAKLVNMGIDKAILVSRLRSLESKGNDVARRLLLEGCANYELTMSVNDFLQDIRLVIVTMESKDLIMLNDENRIVANDTGDSNRINAELKALLLEINPKSRIAATVSDNNELVKAIFNSIVSAKLYKEKRIGLKTHISYEIDAETFIDMYDKKALAQHSDVEKLMSSEVIKDLRAKIAERSPLSKVVRRANVLDGLVLAMTYREIHELYNIPLGTVSADVEFLRDCYKELYGIHRKQYDCKYASVGKAPEHYTSVGTVATNVRNYYNSFVLEYINAIMY